MTLRSKTGSRTAGGVGIARPSSALGRVLLLRRNPSCVLVRGYPDDELSIRHMCG